MCTLSRGGRGGGAVQGRAVVWKSLKRITPVTATSVFGGYVFIKSLYRREKSKKRFLEDTFLSNHCMEEMRRFIRVEQVIVRLIFQEES